MSTNQTPTDVTASATGSTAAATSISVASTPLLGKLREPPSESPPTTSPPPTTNAVVDAAFKRLFGYSWGTKFDLTTSNYSSASAPSPLEREMVQIFGPLRTARILNLPWDIVAPASVDSNTASTDDYTNTAAMFTTKIISSTTGASTISKNVASSLSTATALQSYDTSERKTKKRRLDEINYKNIALPSHMVAKSDNIEGTENSGPSVAAEGATTKNQAPMATAKTGIPTSNLDNVLSKIAGKKQLNTVEKSSNDWEGFKETDKTLQDDLERSAQSKNAYLVKQDFLNRVDHRKFELEKEERDRERSRRASEAGK